MNRLLMRQCKGWSDQKKRQTWESIEKAIKTSGKPIKKLCDERCISEHTFYRWRRRFRFQEEGHPEPKTAEVNGFRKPESENQLSLPLGRKAKACEKCEELRDRIENLSGMVHSLGERNQKLKRLLLDIVSGKYKPEEIVDDMIENLLIH